MVDFFTQTQLPLGDLLEHLFKYRFLGRDDINVIVLLNKGYFVNYFHARHPFENVLQIQKKIKTMPSPKNRKQIIAFIEQHLNNCIKWNQIKLKYNKRDDNNNNKENKNKNVIRYDIKCLFCKISKNI